MSGYWNPKPLRPKSENSIFTLDSDESYTVKAQTPMQYQRSQDGSLHSMNRPSKLQPGRPAGGELYLNEDRVNKSEEKVEKSAAPKLDPDAVIKSFLNKSDASEEEDEKKGIGEAVGKVATSAAKTTGRVAANMITTAGNLK